MAIATDDASFARLTGPGGIAYQPGLEGLRGLAVTAVVAFHLGFDEVSGGYLGVSLFFTLSGVLIGTLILNEIITTGAFSLRRFWARRARRLLPPALVTLAVVATGRLVTTSLNGTSGTDVVASALDVANWHFLAEDASYIDLFGGPSAVLHFWSLAIEEQFYLVIGVLAVLVAARSRRPVMLTGLFAATVAACSFAVPIITSPDVDRVYYGTDTRAGELMVGVAAAAVICSPRRRQWILDRSRAVALVGAAGLAVTLLLWLVSTPGTDAIRRGLLPLTAVASLAVIVGALLAGGPVARLTRTSPLGWLGRISYGLYLVHWPVIIVGNQLTTDRSPLRSVILVAISLTIAQLSSLLIERPVRHHLVPLGRLAAVAAVIVATIGVASAAGGRTTESADLLDDLAAEHVRAGATPAAIGPSPLARVALFGDSIGFSMLLALGAAEAVPAFERSPSDVSLGCGIAVSPAPPPDRRHVCDDPAERFFLKAVAGETDVAVMISCQWELMRQSVPGSWEGTTRVIGDPQLDSYIAARYRQITDRLVDAGVSRVLWMACPYLSRAVGVDELAAEYVDSRDPARIDRLNAIITELASGHAHVDVLPFADWMNERVDDPTIRPDGSHYDHRIHNPAADAFIALVNAALAG